MKRAEGAEVIHDERSQRFYVPTEDGDAGLYYSRHGDQVNFHRTYVPPAQRNHGLAERLVRAGLDWARRSGLQVSASCWYVQKFL